jgi:hypothetical protein
MLQPTSLKAFATSFPNMPTRAFLQKSCMNTRRTYIPITGNPYFLQFSKKINYITASSYIS